MAVFRRDKKKRILNEGELQEKSGRYRYRYIDAKGEQKEVYSWRLTETDPTPAGKRKCKSLREKEREIESQLNDGIHSTDMTVLELVSVYIKTRGNARPSTKSSYRTVYNNLKKEEFAYRRFVTVKASEAEAFMVHLQNESGYRYSSIHNIRGVLRPAFQLAIRDKFIDRNPFDFRLCDHIRNDSREREPLNERDKGRFLEFVRMDKHYSRYYEEFCFLLESGVRISEFCGFTVNDFDFESKTIYVYKQLWRGPDMEYIVLPPKSDSGKREIPMTPNLEVLCHKILDKRKAPQKEMVILDEDGNEYTGFLSYDKEGKPRVALHWEKYIQHAREKYNKTHSEPLPDVTPHICRHTFCTEMANSGMRPKNLQYIMGHAEADITMNRYAHMDKAYARDDMFRIFSERAARSS